MSSGRGSQRKGAEGEKELCAILQQAGYPVERGGSMTFGSIADIVGLPRVHVEVKRTEHLNLNEAMNQAIRDAERFQDGWPCVFHRRNRSGWLVTMSLNDWLTLYGEIPKTAENFRRKGEIHDREEKARSFSAACQSESAGSGKGGRGQ